MDENEAYAKALGARLRAVRNQQRLTLLGVEKKSNGKWKAVVVGSYERGDRAVSVRRLRELAEFYEIAVSELLPAGQTSPAVGRSARESRVAVDLDEIASLADPQAETLKRFIVSIQSQRGAPADRTLGVRQEDLRTLALMYNCTTAAMTKRLEHWQVLVPES